MQTALANFLALDGTSERFRANLLELKGGHARAVLHEIQNVRAQSLQAPGGSWLVRNESSTWLVSHLKTLPVAPPCI